MVRFFGRLFRIQTLKVGLVTRVSEGVIPEQLDDVVQLGVDVREEFLDGGLCHNSLVVKRSL